MLKNWKFWAAVKRPQNEVLIIEEEESVTTCMIQTKQKTADNQTEPCQNTDQSSE